MSTNRLDSETLILKGLQNTVIPMDIENKSINDHPFQMDMVQSVGKKLFQYTTHKNYRLYISDYQNVDTRI